MSRRAKGPSDSPAGSLSEAPSFRVRIGTGRPGPGLKVRGFIGRIKSLVRERGGASNGGSRRAYGGRGGSAAARLPRRAAPQRVVVKTRIVKHANYRGPSGARGALSEHTQYLARRRASADGEAGVAFDGERDLSREELGAFRDTLVPDRHHFRVMVSPELGSALDLKAFAREFVQEVERDLETPLQWIGMAHYDTDDPHVHLLIRGKTAQGADLVVSRDYISHGMRLQAGEVATRHLGPRLAEDIEHSVQRDLKAERITARDRAIHEQATLHPHGWITALRTRDGSASLERERLQTLARLQYLESLGLAREISPGIWAPDGQLLPKLKALSIRGDIIKTLHARMTGAQPAIPTLIVDPAHPPSDPIVGRVAARAHVDEFWDHEYLLVDAPQGKQYYVPLGRKSEDPGREARPGAIVRIDAAPPAEGEPSRAPGVRVTRLAGDDLKSRTRTIGVTFLDRELARGIPRDPVLVRAQGFDADLAAALKARTQQLAEMGLADESEGRLRLRTGFLDQLYERELSVAHGRLEARYGSLQRLSPGLRRRGTVAAIEELPSGPHAVIAGQGQYVLVPATGPLTQAQGRQISLTIGAPRRTVSPEPQALTLAVRYQFELKRTRGIGGPS